MKQMKRTLSLLILVMICGKAFPQDPHFTQYNNARMDVNPAFAGSDSTLDLSLNYRIQWPTINAYRSCFFAADNYFSCLKGGLALICLHDNQLNGVITSSGIGFAYAPHIELSGHKLVLQPGIQVSYFQKHIDMSKLTFGDMIDPRRGFVYSSNNVPRSDTKGYLDLSGGLLLYSTHFYGGAAMHHINQPEEGFFGASRLPYKITLHAGANLPCGKASHLTLSPTVLYMRQQDFYLLLPGMAAKYKSFVIGISYRSEDAMIGTLAFQNRFLRIGYSYDYTVSKLTNEQTGGSHEIALSWFPVFKKGPGTRKALRPI
jgi:type IX secretion system PorP/SprF family membrane protein